MTMKIHPVAEMFPLMDKDGKDFIDLVDSIREDGLQEPLVMDGDVLIDGRNRLAACRVAKIEPRFVQFSEVSKSDIGIPQWIWAKNFSRRQMTDDQKAAVATSYHAWQVENLKAQAKAEAQFKKGAPTPNPNGRRGKQVATDSEPPVVRRDSKAKNAASTAGTIAALAGVSHYAVIKALKIRKAIDDGRLPQSVGDAVDAGKISASEAIEKIEPKAKKEPPKKLSLRERVRKALASLLKKFEESECSKVKEIIIAELA